jgi:hypothetical protein
MTHKHSHNIKNSDPDKGPRMMEGAHHWNKGYQSDNEMTGGAFPEKHMRGNRYLHLQNEISREDATKIERSKRHKIS